MKKMLMVSSLFFAFGLVCSCSVDTDGDNTPDIADQCPTDPNKTQPGQCGCNVEEGTCSNDQDTDGDGTPDSQDQCPTDPNKTQPGQCGCGVAEGSCSDDNPFVATNKLLVEEELTSGQYLESSNTHYRFYLQGDGNLVLRDNQTKDALWSSKTHGKSGTRIVLQADGNLVLYADTNSAIWSSDTNGSNANELRLNDDGSLVLYRGADRVWSVNDAVVDHCPHDPNKTEPGLCGCGVPEGTCTDDPIDLTDKGKIVYPWNATTAIVKAGDSFQVWFDADSSQTLSAVELQGPYSRLSTTIAVSEGDWEYDRLSGNRYDTRVTVSVPAGSPADRYDLMLKTSFGYRVSLGSVKVIKDYKTDYYIMHISDTHSFQAGSDLSLYKVSTIAKIANILDPEMVFVTGDNLYHPTDRRVDQFYNGIPSEGVLGLHDFYAPTFVACGNHDWKQSGPDDNASKALHYNHYYGLHGYHFSYGEGRFMVINNGWGNFSYQTADAAAWLDDVGHGNFRLGGAHIKDSRISDLYTKTNLDMILVGHNHFIADDNPHSIDNNRIQYIASSIRDHAPEFNLFLVDGKTGNYEPVNGPTAQVTAIQNPNDKDKPAVYKPNLTLSFSNANDGSSPTNIATINNLFSFPIQQARIRFVMPKGKNYTVSPGNITQAFDGDSVHIVDVSAFAAAGSKTVVRINAR